MITSPITEAMIEISPGGVGLCRLHRERAAWLRGGLDQAES